MNQDIQKRLIQVLSTLVIQGILLFVFAGTIQWFWAWLFMFLGVIILFIIRTALEDMTLKKGIKKLFRLFPEIEVPFNSVYLVMRGTSDTVDGCTCSIIR